MNKSARAHGSHKDFLEAYDSAAKQLRTWLGAYSVAVPAFLFTHQTSLTRMIDQGRAGCIALLFAIAIALQVALTFINKYVGWGNYAKNCEPATVTRYTNLCDRVSEWIWIDAIVDASTILLLACGTVVVYRSLVG